MTTKGCKLCEQKLDWAWIDEGWLYMQHPNTKEEMLTFPVHFCPWCGKKFDEERMMPKITPKEWKHQMQEQEVENEIDH